MRLHHLAFRTTDVDALVAFYSDALGLRVLRRDDAGRSVWLDAAGTILMIERADQEGEASSINRASRELTCFAIAPDQFADMTARLMKASTPIEDRTAFTIYFRDPDGRRIGLSSYPDASR